MNAFSTSDWIAIVSIFVSIILAFAFYQRVRKKTIILIIKRHFVLNNIKSSEFPHFRVLLDNEDISEFLYYINGTLIMTGDGDVSPDNIRYPVSIIAKNNESLWKKYNLYNKTELLECQLESENNVLKFKLDNIKSNDYVNFDAYYSSKVKGIKASHRILDVKKEILVISEDSVNDYKKVAIATSIFLLFISFLLLSENDYVNEKLWGYKYTKSTEKWVKTKEDSIRYKSYDYKTLYHINNIILDNDSLLVKNKELNNKKNENRKIAELKSLNKIYAKQKNSTSKYFDSIQIVYKDSIYYEDKSSLENKTQKKLEKLLTKSNTINKKDIFKINDTISVSFVNGESHFLNIDNNILGNILLTFLILFIMFILFLDVTAIYYLRIIKKYKKIYSENNS
jgi:hypothetical protein